uniref:Uncharacterized protein n=1 Tax=Oryza punctata TaxID=4537 RepID=A0A0E0LN88_ORYPU
MELPLRCFHGAKVAAAAAAAGDGEVDGRAAVPAKGSVARGLKVVVRGLVGKAGKVFGRSIPAARFGHLAYISSFFFMDNLMTTVCVRIFGYH